MISRAEGNRIERGNRRMISIQAREIEDRFRFERARFQVGFDLHQMRHSLKQSYEMTGICDGVSYRSEILGNVPVIRAIPDRDRGQFNILLIHGGAFCLMSAQTHQRVAGHFAVACQSQVILPDYSLAPEHPYPTALNECVQVMAAAIAERTDHRTALIGDSAGGGLALSAALKMRDNNSQLPFAIALLSPWLDVTLASPSVDSLKEEDPILLKGDLEQMGRMYAGTADPRHPYISPVYGDFEGLPPLFVQVSGLDLLRDDGVRLREAYESQCLDLDFQLDDQMLHFFHFLAGNMPEADEAIALVAEFLWRILDGSVPPGTNRQEAGKPRANRHVVP